MVTGEANRQIARAAGVVMAAFILSNITGLVRQVLVSEAFGTGAEMDAFNAAARLPDLLFSLVAGGALASAFIPTFTGFLTQNDKEGAWQLASAIMNLVSLTLALVSALSAVFAPHIVRYVLSSLVSELDSAQFALTVSLLRVLLLSPVFFGISGLLMGILNAHQVFLLPALAPTMYWSGMIFGVLVLSPHMGIYGLAWGAVLGAGLHLGVQLPGLFRLTWEYIPTLGLQSPAVREVGRLMAPRLLGVAVVQLNFVVNTILAWAQPEGSLTAITIAWAVMTMPQVVIAQAIAIAALPTFSAQAAKGEMGEMRSSLAATLRGVILLSLPASIGLILLREPIVALLFQRGAFDVHSTDLVAWALLWYGAGLVSHSVVEIVSRAFYALHDTKTPVFVGVAAMSLNVGFSFLFASLFSRLGWAPHGGLALANSLATTLEMVGLLVLMRRRLGGLKGNYILQGVFKSAGATLVMGMAILLWLPRGGEQSVWIVGGGGVVIGLLAYGVGVLFLRLPEVYSLLGVARRLVKRG
ncbi:MAG: murein biosynthesis integral membrane protein MurJ [Chloroflexota bacterium]